MKGSVDVGAGLMPGPYTEHMLLARLSSAGSTIWSRVHPEGMAKGVAAGGGGSAIVAGEFQGTIDLGAGPMTSVQQWNGFLLKLAP